MNKIFIIIIVSFVFLGLSNCGDDFLDRNHPGTMSFDKIYKTKRDFDAALAGCYSSFRNQANVNIYFGDFPADNVYQTRFKPADGWTEIKQQKHNAANGSFSSIWSNSYTTIQRVNILLDQMSTSSLDDKDKQLISAEAKFLRAYSYFYLLRIFGGVPLFDRYIDVQDMYDVPRASVEEVKNLILEDLSEAINIDSYRSAGDNSEGRASAIATKTLLAKTYLWLKDFANAESTLADIVNNNGGLDLEDLSVLYHPDQPINKEIIFSINYDRVSGFSFPYVTSFIPFYAPPGEVYPNYMDTQKSDTGNGMIEPFTVEKFSPEDKRLELIDTLVSSYVGTIDTNIYSLKYIDFATTSNGLSGATVIVLRYADVLLMYAEALNENGKTAQAYPYINRIRNRAEIGDLPSGYSKEQMFQALAEERQKEFLMEGDRWFDLVFRGFDFLKRTIDDYSPHAYLEANRDIVVRDNCILFPIPESQMQIQPVLIQNPGY